MLLEVNNLKIGVGIEPERFLKPEERERAMRRLRSGSDIKLSEGKDNKPAKPTRDLGLPSGAVFNLAAGGRKSDQGGRDHRQAHRSRLAGVGETTSKARSIRQEVA